LNKLNPNNKNKRRLILILSAVILLIVLFFYNRNKEINNTLYLYNWSSYTPSSVLELFEEEYDVHVNVDSFSSNEELFAKMLTGANGYDIIFPSQDYAAIMINLGMLQKLDASKLPNLKYISSNVKDKVIYDPNMEYCVPYFMGSTGIGVNKTKVKEYEKTWNIFARKDLAGSMTMMDDMREVIGDALAYNGYSVNSVDPEGLRLAEATITNDWKPNLVKFDTDSFGQAFAAGDFKVVQGYPEIIFGSMDLEDWDNIDFFIPKDGATMYIDNMCIPKGAKNYDLAIKFINFIQRPDIYALFLDEFKFPATVNEEAGKLMTVTPFYEPEAIENSEPMMDLGADLYKFNDVWQRIRFTK
jgi:spermidine/putrescine transport system substrate-binding protein